jgi:hypothetical protein
VKAKPFVIGLLAAMVAAAAVSIYVSATIDKIDKTVAAVASPDGRYKAVRVTLARVGAAPFCVDSISIFLSVYPDNFAENDKTYEVYAAPCAALAKRTALPKVEWLSNTAAQITYAVASPAADAKPPRMKSLDVSHFVRVTFVVGE